MERVPIARPQLGAGEVAAAAAVLQSGRLAAGPLVAEFETAFAAMVGADHGVATSSGTTALQAALRALDLRPGSEVITTPFSFFATASAIVDIGAVPVFADIDPQTYNLSPRAVRDALARHPDARAILGVHLYGLPFDPELREIAKEWGIWLVEDAAQAHGASAGGRRAGSIGDIASFSFYATKNMTTGGEGGMVTTSHPELAARLRLIVNHGQRARYDHMTLGFNYRLTEMQAAIGLVQLNGLEERNLRRRAIAAQYRKRLPPGLRRQVEPSGSYHVYHQYVVGTAARDGLARNLRLRGIDTAVHYPSLIADQEAMRNVLFHREPCPVAEAACSEVLSLPVHAGLSDDEVERVVSAVGASWRELKEGC